MNINLANEMTEVILIGLPGPTHHYGGLSGDNVASAKNQGHASSPRLAALQALGLARQLMGMGVSVGVVPPQLRPYLPELKKYFTGDDASVISQAASHKFAFLQAMTSSASMWVANAATVTPSVDSADGILHLTIANLHTNIHRRIEALASYLVFRQIFAKVPRCRVDMPLDGEAGFRDEGAANHMRLAPNHSENGLNVFVYGTDGNSRDPKTARQTLSASEEIIKHHRLFDDASVVIKQNPNVIEQGVFHNDVIAVSNENMLLVHAEAFGLGQADIDFIADSYTARTGSKLNVRVISSQELSVAEAVNCYFFNSQLITLPNKKMALIAPTEVRDLYEGKAARLMESILADETNPITEIHYADLRQSMQNGGGPACLRLRVPMDNLQFSALKEHSGVIMNDARLTELAAIITATYPESLSAADINYELYLTCKEALRQLGASLKLDLLPNVP